MRTFKRDNDFVFCINNTTTILGKPYGDKRTFLPNFQTQVRLKDNFIRRKKMRFTLGLGTELWSGFGEPIWSIGGKNPKTLISFVICNEKAP